MALDYADLMARRCRDRVTWGERDAMLYALGIGLGTDPTDERELRFVSEQNQRVFPTFAVVLGFAGGPLSDLEIDRRFQLHGEHAIELFGAIPPAGAVVSEGRMLGAWDKGQGKGAVFCQEKLLYLDGSDKPLARILTTAFGRAEGGFGGPREGQPSPHPVPERRPDARIDIPTAGNQALIYRFSGDWNPLHVSPNFARSSGFERPILHGLCTFALTARAVLAAFTEGEPARLHAHQARFSAPVFPGETVSVDLWRDGDVVSFEARVTARNATVIRNGRAVIGEPLA